MVELFIFCLFYLAFIAAHTVSAVVYKIKTHSKKSLWRIMNEEV